MKKILYAILMGLFFFLLLSLKVLATGEDNTEYSFGHFYYHVHEGYVSISGYLGRETEITIPSTISGKPVSEVESGAFNGCSTIQVITIPDTVDTVYSDSFTGMSSLNKIICNAVGVTIQTDAGVEISYPKEKAPSQGQHNNQQEENPVVAPIEDSEPKQTSEDTTENTKADSSPKNPSNTQPVSSEVISSSEIEQGAYEEPEEEISEVVGEVTEEKAPDDDETEERSNNIVKRVIPACIALLAGGIGFIIIKKRKSN